MNSISLEGTDQQALLSRLENLVSIGIELSNQRNLDQWFDRILDAAQELTNSDGGTIYLIRDGRLHFVTLRNVSLGIHQGEQNDHALSHEPIPLHLPDGDLNLTTVSTSAAVLGKTINIADAYDSTSYDFSGTYAFDARNHYRSQSFLTVPMRNHESEVIGVLQLINAKDAKTGAIVPFDRNDQYLVESLASQAAIVFTNRQLIQRLEDLFISFIKVINIALDEKSPYTHGHCQRVPEITMLLAEAVGRTREGPLQAFQLDAAGRKELEIAALMHDCGKITTPVHIVDKATKLQSLFDRIHLLDTRVEVLKRDARIRMLEARLAHPEDTTLAASLETRYAQEIDELNQDRDFLRTANIGSEFMPTVSQERVHEIAARYQWVNEDGQQVPFLSDDEREKLSISRGTLSDEEREIINYHIVATIKMLEALPWPKHLKNVPEFAGGHHERMDGQGYPKGLSREQMSVQARMMAIADIFEALTASDRPYKAGMPLSRALYILGRMCQKGHIDPDLFDIFIREKVYLAYAQAHLQVEQIDEVVETDIPAYQGQEGRVWAEKQ